MEHDDGDDDDDDDGMARKQQELCWFVAPSWDKMLEKHSTIRDDGQQAHQAHQAPLPTRRHWCGSRVHLSSSPPEQKQSPQQPLGCLETICYHQKKHLMRQWQLSIKFGGVFRQAIPQRPRIFRLWWGSLIPMSFRPHLGVAQDAPPWHKQYQILRPTLEVSINGGTPGTPNSSSILMVFSIINIH